MISQGHVAHEFESLRAIFEDALENSHQRGCAFSLRVKGEEVANLWGGQAREGQPWQKDTMTVLFSCTKGLVSLLASNLVSKKLLKLDVQVAHYWPEFAQAGKAEITVRQLLSHHAGLSALHETLEKQDVLNWQTMVHALERAEPLFAADGPHQYHAVTFGWLAGELMRRVTGKGLNELLQETIAKPLDVEVWIGTPADRLQALSVIANSPDTPAPPAAEHWQGLKRYELAAMTLGNAFPSGLITADTGFNDPQILQAEIGGAGGVSSAAALARIWSAAAGAEDGIELLSDEARIDMCRVQSAGDPAIHMEPPYPTWGTGFMLNSPARTFLTEKSFGHDGYGGQVTFADPEHKVGFAFISNDIQPASDNRATSLVLEVRKLLGIK